MPGPCELIDAGMKALQRADADLLWDLTRRAQEADPPATVAERKAAAEQLLTFKQFLWLTRRNLQLLGAVCRRPDSYGEPGN